MARVNVETRALAESRFFNLMTQLNYDRMRTIGLLVLFWHDTQERLVVDLPKKDLFKFLPVPAESKEQVFEALVHNDYLHEIKDGRFEIKGNRRQIAYLLKQKERGKLGGIKSGKSRSKSNTSKQALGFVPPPASKSKPDSIRFDSIQSDSIQFNSIQKEKIPSGTELSVPDTAPVSVKATKALDPLVGKKMSTFFAAYATAYKARYKSYPESMRDVKIIGQVKAWIKMISEEKAVQLIQVYLQIDYRPFRENCHDLWGFFRHRNRIGNALASGQPVDSINWGNIFAGAG